MWSIVVCSSSVIEGFNPSPSLLPLTIHCIFSLRCCNYIPVLALGDESQQCIVIISSAEGIVNVLSMNFSQSEAQWVPRWPIRGLISSCASTCPRHLSWWRLGPIAHISLIKYQWLRNFLLLQKLIGVSWKALNFPFYIRLARTIYVGLQGKTTLRLLWFSF